jgi:protein-disulfide isomerase
MKKYPRLFAAGVGIVMVSAAPLAFAFARATAEQAPAPPPQAPALTQQQINEEMLKELKAIHQLLEKLTTPQQPQTAPQPATARVTNLTGYVLGRPDAPLTMVEFTDLQCPFCRQYMLTSFDEIKKNWIDTGKLRYISRDFPLDFHPQAMPAARAARCAGEQGKFWEMRLGLMRNANLLTPEYIAKTASDLKIDAKPFAACTASTKFDAEIQAEIREGTALGVGGTPTFVMGRTTATSVEGPVVVGALPYAQFDAKLKSLLAPESK